MGERRANRPFEVNSPPPPLVARRFRRRRALSPSPSSSSSLLFCMFLLSGLFSSVSPRVVLGRRSEQYYSTSTVYSAGPPNAVLSVVLLNPALLHNRTATLHPLLLPPPPLWSRSASSRTPPTWSGTQNPHTPKTHIPQGRKGKKLPVWTGWAGVSEYTTVVAVVVVVEAL